LTNIHFIINPIAGSGKNKITKELLQNNFESDSYNLVIKYSNYKKQAIVLTQESISENANIIVACGGDGTINEVASCLVNSPVLLGIIPTGSGNGLASNLNIPKNINKAIPLLKKQIVKKIDVGSINNQPFFSNTGIGFDTKVIKRYEASKNRKLSSYFKACIKVLFEKKTNEEIEITINGDTQKINPFMVFISNSNELGYNVSLTPEASLQDGLLDVLVVNNINRMKIVVFGFLVLFKKHHLLHCVKSYKTKHIKLSIMNEEKIQTQIDGEYQKIMNNTLNITILENALKVIA
jgi:YegS/Rv2252/BmrU family lipid kinase